MAVLLYVDFIMTKVQMLHVTKSLDTSQNMAVNLAGSIGTSVNIVEVRLQGNSDPDKINGLRNYLPAPNPWP